MAIKVCDAIMGSGKTSATISLFNSHPEKKYIYITPYLDEASRIRDACPKLRFVEPSRNLPDFGFKKYNHTLELIKEGKNITSTHKMFTMYTEEMTYWIKQWGYTLVIDEAVDIFENSKISLDDISLLKDVGWLVENDEGFKIDSHDYKRGKFEKIVALSKSNRLVRLYNVDGSASSKVYYWMLFKELFEAFDDVYVLTYLFEHQIMKYYFDLNNVTYENIGISHPSDSEYYFSDTPDYIPEYVANLVNKIHIVENDKLNSIGDEKNALSSSWVDRSIKDPDHENLRALKNNINNFFRNYNGDISADKRLWSVYNKATPYIRAKGFYRSDLAFNTKATNEHSDKTALAYCVNVYMLPCIKNHLISCGIRPDEERYALSIMVQWIWRSAIRKGEEIHLYVPSKRMREVLKEWIDEVQASYYSSVA